MGIVQFQIVFDLFCQHELELRIEFFIRSQVFIIVSVIINAHLLIRKI